MKEGWEYCLFKDVFPIKMGKTPPRGDSSSWDKTKETNNYWVSIADISQNEGKTIYDTKEYITDKAAEKIFKVKANSLLMSFKLSIGRMAFAGVDLYTNEAIIAIPESDDYNLRFLYYYLASYDWKTLTEGNEKVKGATLNKESIGKIKLPILSLAEQQQIVSFLDSEFEKIDALKANAETQLQAAKDLFQAALKELLTPKEGWVEKKFGDVCHYYKVQGKWENIEYIGLEHIEAHTSNLLATISANDVESSTFKFNKGDVLYGRLRPYLQKVVIAPFDGCCSTEIFPIKSNIINNAFLKYWLLSDRVTEIMINSCSGCRMPRANMNDFKQETIHYPQFEDQQRIAARLDALSANVKALQTNYAETITLCNDLKQALLKKVFG